MRADLSIRSVVSSIRRHDRAVVTPDGTILGTDDPHQVSINGDDDVPGARNVSVRDSRIALSGAALHTVAPDAHVGEVIPVRLLLGLNGVRRIIPAGGRPAHAVIRIRAQ